MLATPQVRKITTTMAAIAKKAVAQVEHMSNKLIPETENGQKMFSNLLDTTKKVTKVIEQTEKVNSGNAQISERIVSFCDPDARPIPKGKVGKRVEFGYKLQVMESECGIISGYQLYKGNPSDKTLMDDILQHHIRSFKKVPKMLALDRGYYDSNNEKKAFKAGIKNVCMPKQGKKSKARTQYESSRIFKRLKRWRAGIEGRISYLKRRFGLRRSMIRGYQRTQTWTGMGIFAHNLRQYAKLTIT